MQNSENLEETLRETACVGDIDKVGVLVNAGVDINSQNRVNGWTALHWAAKRKHKHVVSFLLQSGANPTVRSYKNELAINVTDSEEIKQLLSVKGSESVKDHGSAKWLSETCSDAGRLSKSSNQAPQESSSRAGFVPNYLINPEFPYLESTTEFATRHGLVKQNDGLTSSVGRVQNNEFQFATLSERASCIPSTDDCVLVLKCRLAESEEKDFIEVELDQRCLNFEALVETCMRELNVDKTRLKKIRKLPNTIVRNDRDVKRLVQYQEIEVVINET